MIDLSWPHIYSRQMQNFLKFLTVAILTGAFLFWFTPEASGQKIVSCRCDVDAAGNCLPCPEKEEDQKAPPVPKNDSEKEFVCPCGYDPGGRCVPCNYPNKEDAN